MGGSEKVLVARHSAFRMIRLTEDAEGLRTLRFGPDGASQSVVKVDDPRHLALSYARLVPACLAFCPDAVRVLIVGLGGGTLPRFLHSHFPAMQIEVVEIDPDVVEVARDYCGVREDERLRITVADGRDFIEASSGSYDFILLDSFDTDSIPAHLTTLEFATAVRAALNPKGLAVANIWGRAVNPLYGSMLLTYREALAQVYIFDIPTAGTKLFVGLPEPRTMTREEVRKAAAEIATRHGIEYDLAGTIAGYRDAALETTRAGAVLRD